MEDVNLNLIWREDLVLGNGFVFVEYCFCWFLECFGLLKIEEANNKEVVI